MFELQIPSLMHEYNILLEASVNRVCGRNHHIQFSATTASRAPREKF